MTTALSLLFPRLQDSGEPGFATYMGEGEMMHDMHMYLGSDHWLQSRLTLSFMRFDPGRLLLYTVTLQVRGEIPTVPAGSSVSFAEYTEDFKVEGSTANLELTSRNRIVYYVDQLRQSAEVDHSVWVRPASSAQCLMPLPPRLHTHEISFRSQDRSTTFNYYSTLSAAGTTRPTDPDSFSCVDTDICHEFAACVEKSDGSYQCECVDGFSGDGLTCEEEGAGKEIDCNNCDRNAECVFEEGRMARYCQCREGFSGDGRSCSRIQDRTNPCDPNPCHYYAECRPISSRDYDCSCRPGYTGNGRSCYPEPERDCRTEPDICSADADCQLDKGSYGCVCRDGYIGDGRSCSWKPVPRADQLLVAQGLSLVEVPLHESDRQDKPNQLVYRKDFTIVGVDTDCDEHTVFYSEVAQRGLWKKQLYSGESELVSENLLKPEGVAVDWISNNIYVTDSELKEVALFDYSGENKIVLVDSGVDNPRSIAVDPQEGYLYWTDWQRNSPRINVAEMDGSNVRQLVTEGLELPNALTLDTDRRLVCWADAGTAKLECARTDGFDRRTVAMDIGYPFAMTHFGANFYFTNWKDSENVVSVDKSSGEIGKVPLPIASHGRMYGIVAVKQECPRATNACSRNNGGCPRICVPLPGGNKACLCPEDDDECNEIIRFLN